MADWTFLSNHAHVLICIARDPELRMRDIAASVGITERAAQRIVAELVDEGYLEIQRSGRRNTYLIHSDVPLRHQLEAHHSIGELLGTLGDAGEG
ncbi:MarR family protein [Arthrobacter subterraneus]|uniref:MarR family protein n=1 Tax=Arthrobacter subterraneus TaxID=335973 RepID=A0A1G8MVA4_9MICC|nr:helix-turn-helix domain-containing protein [Arthrobacter subterraneus]SDI71735.1 MarR family protein [Arthrobacter subterraneus]